MNAAREAQRQRALLEALLAPAALDGGWLRDAAPRAARGLAAYRANAGALAERSLAAAFPTLRALLGEEAFAALARDYWRRSPPQRGDAFQAGAGLADFVAASAQLADVPYLADCARLDWLLACAEGAADADLDAASLARLGDTAPGLLALELAPGSALLASAYPVAAIRRAHADASFDAARAALEAGRGETVFVWRRGLRALCEALDAPEAAFAAALLDGRPLGAALDAAGAAFAFDAWLARALERGWLRRVRVTADAEEPRP